MTFRTALLSATALAVAAGLGYGLFSAGTAQNPISGKDRDAIEAVIHDYLMENPEVIMDALDRYHALEALREEEASQRALQTHLSTLMSDDDAFATGAAAGDAKVYVIEMFDYHCGFCKEASQYVSGLLEDERDVRVVFRELPILREESDTAAYASLAARDQGKYPALHFAMMDASGILTKERIEGIAQDVGIDIASMHQAIDTNDYDGLLLRNREIAIDIAVSGTPAFIVVSADGSYSRLISGWQEQMLEEAIEEARKASS